MSFFSDLFHGNFSNLGRDLSEAPSSLARHPSEMVELGLGAAGLAAPFLLPELGAGIGGLFGGEAALGGSEASLAGLAGGAALPEASTLATGALDPSITGFTAGPGTQFTEAYDALPGVFPDQPASSALNFGPLADQSAFPGIPTDPLASGNPLAGINFSNPGAPGTFDLGSGTDLNSLVNAYQPTTAGATQPFTDLSAQLGANDIGAAGAMDASGGAGGGESFIDKLVSGVKGMPGAAVDQVVKNPLGVGLGVGGLAYTMMQGQKQLPEQSALTGQAQQLSDQGKQFMAFLQTGTLPAGMQAAVDRAANAAKAQIIARHASQGQSSDPNQNSALAQELQQAQQNALIAVAQEGQMLFQAGLSEVQLSSQIYERLMQIDQQQTANMGKAIANFASALSMKKAA